MKAWFKINQSNLPGRIVLDWTELLDDKSKREEDYQKYLSYHSRFFFPKEQEHREQLILEKLKFGADYISDFILCDNQRSYGFKYTLVEIESPHTPAFTGSGEQSARLKTAIQQIMDWQHWIDSNRDSAKRIFPSKEFVFNNVLNFKYMIVIGRREEHAKYQEKISFLANKIGIEIRSFDYLTDIARSRRFFSFTMISQDLTGPTLEQNNEFSNPFCLPINDSTWRKITSVSRFVNSHMIGNNINLLLPELSYNKSRLEEFEHVLGEFGNKIDEWEYNFTN